MINQESAETVYQSRIGIYNNKLTKIEKQLSLLSNIRLAVVIISITSFYYVFNHISHGLGALTAIFGTILFITFILLHTLYKDKQLRYREMLLINQEGLDRIKGSWNKFTDRGDDYIDPKHAYSSDLDIFGVSSLFQKYSTARTYFGRHTLASIFCGEHLSGSISEKQNAVKELAPLISLRQNIELEGRISKNSSNPSQWLNWFSKPNQIDTITKFQLFFLILPLLSLIIFSAEFFFASSFIISPIAYILQLVIALIYYVSISREFDMFDGKHSQLISFSKTISLIEDKQFDSLYLNSLQQNCKNSGKLSASTALKSIAKIIARSEFRKNSFPHFFINVITLWDIRIILQARSWKKQYGNRVETWLKTIGEFEALSSLSVIAFENNKWTFPSITDDIIVEGKNICHPLLKQENVIGNDYSMNAEKRVTIVSGSNMSGKSTFLRTVALNLVLTYSGAPVHANSFCCGQFSICSSMRTTDDLSDNVSTFYAELLKIKNIVDSVRNEGNIFFIIDEIFSGTNSHDRIEGAREVLKLLHRDTTLGMISTHDLELCNLTEEKSYNFFNTHFREYFKSNEITFDYTLRDGPSTTRNALQLMNMVGILSR